MDNYHQNYHRMSQFWLLKMPVKFRQKIRHFRWLLSWKKNSPTNENRNPIHWLFFGKRSPAKFYFSTKKWVISYHFEAKKLKVQGQENTKKMNRHNLLGVVSICWDTVDNSKWNQTFMPLNSDLLRPMFLCHKAV